MTNAHVPAHAHGAQGVGEDATSTDPTGKYFARADDDVYTDNGTAVTMDADIVGTTGGGQPHNNIQPWLGINFCIALQGLWPG